MTKLPQKESVTVEFKSTFNEETIESLVAFSNAKGGTIYVGLSDKGKVQGVTVGKETIPNWVNEIKLKTTPQIIADADVITIDKKTVVALFAPEYPIKPVSIRGRYYKRTGNSNHLLSVDEIANEHLKTINSSWDFFIDKNHSEADLSKEKIAKFIKRIKQNDGILQAGLSNNDILAKMEILRNGKITFGACILFAKDYCTISDVQVGRFKSDITIIDSVSLNSDLFHEVDDILTFIKKHLKVEYIITGEP
jgi:ATP-dependent DNA helicase RecG